MRGTWGCSDCQGHLAPGGCSASPATSSRRRRRVASSSRSHRRPAVSSPRRRRRVVVSRLGAARVAMFGPCRSRVVAARRRRRRRSRRLRRSSSPSSPSPPLSSPAALTTSAGRRAVVCSPVSHGYPHPPALTTSAGRRAVASSAPASILTAILTGILTVILAPDHHLTTHPQHLYLKPVMEGGCSDCEDLGLGALQRGWGCSGAWGLQLLWGPGHCSEAGGLQGAAAS